MFGVPSYYGADDLLLNSLYDQGCRICNNPSASKPSDYPSDSVTISPKNKAKKVLKAVGIGAGIVLAGSMLLKGFGKFFKKAHP